MSGAKLKGSRVVNFGGGMGTKEGKRGLPLNGGSSALARAVPSNSSLGKGNLGGEGREDEEKPSRGEDGTVGFRLKASGMLRGWTLA